MAGFIPLSGRSNPLPAIVRPTGANAIDFSHKDRMTGLSKHFALGLKLWLERENNIPGHDEAVQDVRKSLKKLRDKLKKGVKKNASVFIVENGDALHVVKWALLGRNSSGHNNLPRLNSNEHYYLSSIAVLMGQDMCNYPVAHAEAIAALTECALVPLTVSQLLQKNPV